MHVLLSAEKYRPFTTQQNRARWFFFSYFENSSLTILKISSSDIDLYEICENECSDGALHCLESCLSDDQCKSKCFRDEIDCLDKGFLLMLVIEKMKKQKLKFIKIGLNMTIPNHILLVKSK